MDDEKVHYIFNKEHQVAEAITQRTLEYFANQVEEAFPEDNRRQQAACKYFMIRNIKAVLDTDIGKKHCNAPNLQSWFQSILDSCGLSFKIKIRAKLF